MSHLLFVRNADLKRLRDEGYFVQIVGGLLLMREVPYVDSQKRVRRGTLISSLTMAGDITQRPDTHVVHFDGELPCSADGHPLNAIINQSGNFQLGNGVSAQHMFSSKPEGGYPDYYEKMSIYAGMLSGHAAVLDKNATAKTFQKPDEDDGKAFNYLETASDRAGIGALTERLSGERVAIIGVGGTGSYILDLVAKTPVAEIRLIDGDEFLQHNAFRVPGAPTLEQLREVPMKVDYLAGIYSRMHRGIVKHAVAIGADNLHLLDGITFAFISMDASEDKHQVVQKLESIGASFADVGMGLELVDGSLGGILRVTLSTPEKRDLFHTGHISYGGVRGENLYASNIQVADLNALNATLAVFRWKRLRGFYCDLEREHYCTFTTDGNLLLNEVPKC